MFKVRGLRLVLEYFFYNQLFDIINKTDTHKLDDNIHTGTGSSNEIYMASWSKDIRKATKILIQLLPDKISNYSLIDLGSGKGKVLLTWRRMLPTATIIGVEYDKNLANISLTNINIMNYSNIDVIVGDAANCSLGAGKKVVAMYNPFGEEVITSFFERYEADDIFVIYFNPVALDCMKQLEFEVLYSHKTYRGGSSFKIFGRNKIV